jgi:hypothetical protein
VELTKQAHEAELEGKFKEAYELHCEASSLLFKVIFNGQKKSEERRRAKLNHRASIDRQNLLKACVAGTGLSPPAPLPSFLTFPKEILSMKGIVPLSLVGHTRAIVCVMYYVSDSAMTGRDGATACSPRIKDWRGSDWKLPHTSTVAFAPGCDIPYLL